MTDLTRELAEIAIETGPGARLLVRTWTNAAGRSLVTIASQYETQAGEWRLRENGLLLPPTVARQLAPALLEMAASIEPGEPSDPQPTEEDRDGSRWP